MAAALLMRVGELNGRLDYAEKAQETLETFAGVVEHFGLYAATYALALQRLVREPVQVCVVGEDAGARALEAAALARYAVWARAGRLAAACAGDDSAAAAQGAGQLRGAVQRAHLPASGEDAGGVDRTAAAQPVRAKN
jgi:uncharacterized protein YyaL (SSP411 family)